jgi:hypothetical protein
MKKLTGNQSKLDLNKNGKLDSNDFKMLRGEMAKGGGTKGNYVPKGHKGQLYDVFAIKNGKWEKLNDEVGGLTKKHAENLVNSINKGDGANFTKGYSEGFMDKEGVRSFQNYGNGGGTGVSSETGYAEGTNASLLMNQDYLAYANGGGISKRTVVEVGEEEITNIVNKKEKTGFPVYVTTSGYSPQTLNLYPTKEKAMTAAKALAKKNGYELKGGKMANGGSLADTPESFPSTDAMSYKKGGGTGKMYYHVLEYGDYGNIGYQGVFNTLEEAQKEADRLKDFFPEMDFKVFTSQSRKEPPITTMAKGGSTSGWCYSIGGL